MNLEFLSAIVPMLFRGLKVTMLIAVVGIMLGFILGALNGYALQCKNNVARKIANISIWIILGTSLVVQLLSIILSVSALVSLFHVTRISTSR